MLVKQKSLYSWLHDRRKQKKLNGKSPEQIFRRIGITKVAKLKEFLKLPDVSFFLAAGSLKPGETSTLEIEGTTYILWAEGPSIRIIEKDSTVTRIFEGFDKIDADIGRLGFKAWKKTLPAWGGTPPKGITVKHTGSYSMGKNSQGKDVAKPRGPLRPPVKYVTHNGMTRRVRQV